MRGTCKTQQCQKPQFMKGMHHIIRYKAKENVEFKTCMSLHGVQVIHDQVVTKYGWYC